MKTGETAVGDEKIGYAEDNHVRKQTRGIYIVYIHVWNYCQALQKWKLGYKELAAGVTVTETPTVKWETV